MIRIVFLLILALIFTSCGGDDEGTSTNCTSTLEQAEMLEFYADLIQTRSVEATSKATAANDLATSYNANPTETELAKLQDAVLELWSAWIYVEPFAYGPRGDLLSKAAINPFPVDETAVVAIVAAGSFDKSSLSNFDRGLPALDYLLFNGSLTEIHQRLDTSAGERAVIRSFTASLADETRNLQVAWNNGRGRFTTSTGTSAGSGTSVLINALSRHFEDTRRDRIGTPFGVTTLGFPNPQTVEAPYSGQSLSWLSQSIDASRSAFFGSNSTTTTNPSSLAGYIVGLPPTDAKSLVDDIKSQYLAMLMEVADIDGLLATAVEQDVDDVQEAYNAISRQVVNLKTDVPSVACVSITYVDNPSDSD